MNNNNSESNYEKKCSIYSSSILDSNNFELSDSDDENEDEFKNIINDNKHLLDDLELKYYPEPYNSLGQFIVSAIVGAYTTYLMNIKNKKIYDEMEYHKYLDIYFKYCKYTKNDDYITKLCTCLKLTDEDNLKKYSNIMDKSNELCKKIIDNMVKSKILDKFSNMIGEEDSTLKASSSNDISDKFNLELFNSIIPFIKFTDINNCLL